MTPLTREQIAGLRALIVAATPGPWQAKNEHEWDEIIGNIDGPDAGQFHYTHICSVDMHDLRTAEQRANAALIASAVNALPALLDIAEAVARAEIVDAEEDGFISTYAPMNAKRVLVLPLAGEVANG